MAKVVAQKSAPKSNKPAAQKTEVSAVEAAPAKPRSDELMTVTVEARERDATLIVPKSVNGKERWFAKSEIKSFAKAETEGQFVITATRREFAYRGMEQMASPVAH